MRRSDVSKKAANGAQHGMHVLLCPLLVRRGAQPVCPKEASDVVGVIVLLSNLAVQKKVHAELAMNAALHSMNAGV